MANWGANHGAFSYGHYGAELITLCSMLRIPINMHNIQEDELFRRAPGTCWAWIRKVPISGLVTTMGHYTEKRGDSLMIQ